MKPSLPSTPDGDDVAHADIPQSAVTEVATRSQSSAEPTFAHIPVAAAYKDEQHCMDHKSHFPQPNTGETPFEWGHSHAILCVTYVSPYPKIASIAPYFYFPLPIHLSMRAVHKSELAIGKTKGVSLMLKELKNCSDPKKYFDPDLFLEALQLDSLLPRLEVDTSFYITNRARLEQMYPYLPQDEGMVAEVVYSVLKHAVSEEEEARAVRDTCKQAPNILSESEAAAGPGMSGQCPGYTCRTL